MARKGPPLTNIVALRPAPSPHRVAQGERNRVPEYDGPITGTDLRALIQRNFVLRGGYGPPSAEALEPLAFAVSTLRGRCRMGSQDNWAPNLIALDAHQRRASEALQTLAEVLPVIRAELKRLPNTEPFPMRASQLRQIDALNATVNEAWEWSCLTPLQELHLQVTGLNEPEAAGAAWALAKSTAWSVPPPSPIRELHSWHHFAAWLADQFRDVVQATNPKKPRLGLGENGPVARFVALVIPLITGEQPRQSSVRIWLQRAATRAKSASF